MTTPNRSSDRLSPVGNETLRDLRVQTPESLAYPARAAAVSRTHYFDSKLKLSPGVTIPLRSTLGRGRPATDPRSWSRLS